MAVSLAVGSRGSLVDGGSRRPIADTYPQAYTQRSMVSTERNSLLSPRLRCSVFLHGPPLGSPLRTSPHANSVCRRGLPGLQDPSPLASKKTVSSRRGVAVTFYSLAVFSCHAYISSLPPKVWYSSSFLSRGHVRDITGRRGRLCLACIYCLGFDNNMKSDRSASLQKRLSNARGAPIECQDKPVDRITGIIAERTSVVMPLLQFFQRAAAGLADVEE